MCQLGDGDMQQRAGFKQMFFLIIIFSSLYWLFYIFLVNLYFFPTDLSNSYIFKDNFLKWCLSSFK